MKLICINCPRGCHLNVKKVDGEIRVTGNSCPRGMTYAISEMTNPLRTVTTTLPIDSEMFRRVPVISSVPSSMQIIILTIVIAALASFIRPMEEEEVEHGD